MTDKTNIQNEGKAAEVETSLDMSESNANNRDKNESKDGVFDPESVRYETTPTMRPVLIVLCFVLVAGVGSIGILWIQPALVGGAELAGVVGTAIAILVSIMTVKFLIQILILSRTRYKIRDNVFQREYELLHRAQSREIPVEKLRGHEYSQSRIQSFLGFGTVRLLTAGTNQSLGFIEFEHIREPESIRKEIRTISYSDKRGHSHDD